MKRYTLLIILALAVLTLSAQVTTGITIGGDVYGGGKQGAVNIGNAPTIEKYTAEEAAAANVASGKTEDQEGYVKEGDVKTPKNDVKLTDAAKDATSVIISDKAVVRTVFGGGMNGRCYGQTNVIVEGGEIGAAKWSGTIHGGVFGAGDGATAYVFGRENSVLVKGGKIWNNVYGGGNQADLMGCTKVTLQDGEYYGSVFGGARMANIFGHAYLNLDGKNSPTDHVMVIPAVYGGNDISGTIALSTNDNWPWTKKDGDEKVVMPFTPKMEEGNLKVIDNTWSAFIQSTSPTDVTNNNFFVGNLYGGGNGDYEYTNGGTSLTLISTPAEEASTDFVAATYYTAEDQEVTNGTKNVGDVKTPQVGTAAVAETTEVFDGLSKPELAKTYLNLQGGTYGYVYGGGNNATVTESTDIMVWNAHFDSNNNNSAIMASIPASRVNDMGVQKSMFTIDGDKAKVAYQIDRIFGGNNKAAMAIQPNWYLAQGSFNNIYSGGNKGDMTNADGILISIGSRSVYANNVYGGCRMSDVHPKDGSGNDVTTIPEKEIPSLKVSYNQTGQFTGLEYSPYKFAKDYAARVYITEGHINNVYGGNDISGRVYMGTNVAIAGAISGNVYGGGNGSYAYTDNAELAKDTEYADLYYAGGTDASTSITALNDYRPHVENTLLHIWGNDGMANNQYTEANDQEPVIAADGSITAKGKAVQPVIVTGGVYCGGNSATLESVGSKIPTATFNIGKNVIINAVFLGSNGENMVSDNILQTHASTIDGNKYSKFDLKDEQTFATYMKGCAVDIRPTIVYDWTDEEEPHTYIGSLFGGGNVGSVTYDKQITLDMPTGLKIFNHVVGGCNNANVEAGDNNAPFEGGFITANSGADASKPKLTINMQSYLEPRKLNTVKKGVFLESAKLPWNVHEYFKTAAINDQNLPTGEHLDSFKALESANVYAGCYTSGIIQGNVEVNIDHDLISPDVFTMLEGNSDAAIALKTKGAETLTPAMALKQMGNYAMANTMLVYGGGYGEETTIKGDVHVNLSGDARVLSVLGGAEEGVVTGSTYVKAAVGMKDYSTENNGALPFNSVAIYGGAYAGPIKGHTELRLNGGTFLNAFGGSCNADIEGYASTYIGNGQSTGYPFIRGYVFGGNDFGGYIKGYKDYTSAEGKAGYNSLTVRSPRYVEYNSGRIGDDNSGETSIYGGSYGSYDYTKYYWSTAVIEEFGEADYEPDPDDVAEGDEFHFPLANEVVSNDGLTSGGFITNTYVNIQSKGTDPAKDNIARGIFGGGRGVMERTGIVDATQTYVYLHGATWAQRNANLSTDVYGGGYFSVVDKTRVDLETGCTGFAYGGSYGTTAQNLNNDKLKGIHYNSIRTEVNLYNGMDNSNMAIFGGGGYAGSTETYVNLYGGTARNVYGGSYNEGYCQTTRVDVPLNSTAVVNAIFGGGFGNNVALPCDEDVTNVTFSSSTAYVADAIYGGNNDKRAAKTTHIDISVPVKKSADGLLADVYGGGNGASTVCGETNVALIGTAAANNIYGGGRDGKVFGYYQKTSGAPDYYDYEDAGHNKPHGHANWEFIPAVSDMSWEGSATYINETPAAGTDLFGYYTKESDGETAKYKACVSGTIANGTTVYYRRFANTNITLEQGTSAQNVFGGGCGANATVCGTTRVHLHGGSVVGDGVNTGRIFGGGESGDVRPQNKKELAENSAGDVLVGSDEASEPANQQNNIYTYSCLWGGDATITYGGGFLGEVTGETRIEIGEINKQDHYKGVPVIQRSLYGGGYSGPVYGKAKVQMLNGYIGYKYDDSMVLSSTVETKYSTEIQAATNDGKTAEADKLTAELTKLRLEAKYVENIKGSDDDTQNILKDNGNLFGGGYGEGATTDQTIVYLYDGTIRNSLYGGGEIASIGRVKNPEQINVNDRSIIPEISVAGSTEVNMYGGLVTNNVFGGGRGYAIDAYGNTKTGEIGYSDGYTFGKTLVNIHRGTIGTTHSIADGNGNVFGGGNIGYVYGGDNNITGDKKNVSKSNIDKYYHVSVDGTGDLSEDCKVVVAPACLVETSFGTHKKGDYAELEELNGLANNADAWNCLDKLGVNIGNAVFAGGNVSAGSDKIYANTKTVYGNATASVTDVYTKDFITIGGEGIGGLYGDGNLTFVDGYRELNITNYGTDYYNLNKELTVNEYYNLTDRERAYFELLYKQKDATENRTYSYYYALEPFNYTPANGVEETYSRGQKITPDFYNSRSSDTKWTSHWKSGSTTYKPDDKISDSEYNLMDTAEQSHWNLAGFCTLYAGRMLNTIQRADFCGVFGSRLVLKGSQDRVPSVVDYTDYTINRVGELSLNQKKQTASSTISHGNYFGIYGVVHYLGALTSDVDFFEDVRATDNEAQRVAVELDNVTKEYGTAKYSEWKQGNLTRRNRNNGSSPNEIALASGVWLEIVDESTETKPKVNGNVVKDYGPITGVVQLDLINVATGEGGGYVYAKNEHGVRNEKNMGNKHVTLTDANYDAISHKIYSYSVSGVTDKMQTSGNFVNSVKRIVDDCFPTGGKYYGSDMAPAHYWYVRGEFYVYDQYISAYTGGSQSYAEQVSIPLTITAEAKGRLKLESVNQNLFAYWTDAEYDAITDSHMKPTASRDTLLINGITYGKNDPISYYEWNRLAQENPTLQNYFQQMTYICSLPCKIGETVYAENQVISSADYNAIFNDNDGNTHKTDYVCTTAATINGITVNETEIITKTQYDALTGYKSNFQPLIECFHPSNEISHDKGYMLTFDWDNPDVWNQYYHEKSGNTVTRTPSDASNYVLAPTFKAKGTSNIYGQSSYTETDIIDKATYDYQAILRTEASNANITVVDSLFAKFAEAYVAIEDCKFAIEKDGQSTTYTYVKGAPISEELYLTFGSNQSHFQRGYLVTETYDASDTEHYLFGEIVPASVYNGFADAVKQQHFSAAYICTKDGNWGGQVFVNSHNYEAIKYGNLLPSERGNFVYNYDALDLLSENFDADGVKNSYYQGAAGNHANEGHFIDAQQIGFCEEQSLDYTAIYNNSTALTLSEGQKVTLTRDGEEKTDQTTIQKGDVLSNTVFESLRNYPAYYSAIVVKGGEIQNTYYVVKSGFQVGDVWYSPGRVISGEIYDNLQNKDTYVASISSSTLNSVETLPESNDEKTYYFCKEEHTDVNGNKVAVGTLIKSDAFSTLINQQKNFDVVGPVPSETATLYVARGTDIKDLQKDKIITPIYWYEYIESDDNGNYETVRERHIINIHIHFESGVPSVGELLPPGIVLPGTSVGLNQPSVAKGAYEILGGGWEMYSNEEDANRHKNGVPYTNNNTKMYWYQDGYFVAYYAKSYLGKTYSNPVKFSVANYHNMEEVMTSKHTETTTSTGAQGQETITTTTVPDYMYISEAVEAGKRYPKIYIGDTKTAEGKSELDYLADLYALTASDSRPANLSNVVNCEHLDFILKEDIHQTGEWTSIGAAGKCFAGDLHGNGHAISGLTNSLFSHFGANVYNLGVTGNFTGAGIADVATGCNTAHAYNCWVATSGTLAENTSTKAVFGDAATGQVVNCYYPLTNKYATSEAISRPFKSFLDGEVAYNLNSFYLKGRYYRGKGTSAVGDNQKKYYELLGGDLMVTDTDGKTMKLNANQKTMSYDVGDLVYNTNKDGKRLAYVEDYVYGTPDFLYADNKIPSSYNIRRNSEGNYYPVFPDDYLFFGQHLTYGIVPGTTSDSHVDHPEAVNRVTDDTDESKNTKLLATSNVEANRVYRAPAYYNSKTMSTAYFNKPAAFKDTYTLSDGNIYGMSATENVYKNLTAIDFTGYNDGAYAIGGEQTAFYPPLLDYDGISSFNTSGVTRNLLVYDDPSGDATSYGVLNTALPEATLEISNDGYSSVAIATDAASVKGHLVDWNGSTFVATRDHYLVDREVFNCPISYTFSDNGQTGSNKENYYMWYQRKPDNYVDASKGWEAISLPFTADLVSTQTKGEITHFYHQAGSSTYDNGYDSGHEYWLREFKGIGTAPTNAAPNTYYAAFNYPKSVAGYNKTDNNVFLWDYYYSHDDNAANGIDKDNNTDDYQTYYKVERSYPNYPLYTAAKSYIVGFPGKRYYEFDMSGNFQPQNRSAIDKLDPQTISFVSKDNATIDISDNELDKAKTAATAGGYIYVPNYSNDNLAANNAWMLNTAGSSFEKITADKAAVPFRPYFTAESSGAKSVSQYDEIAITSVNFNKGIEDKLELSGELNIYAKKGVIVVESGLDHKVGVTIFNSSGMTVTTFSIASGEKVETNVPSNVIYIVNKKKLFVK